jgi:putative ABC transport system permease protein
VSGPRRIVRRLLATFSSRRIDRDLREEIDAHLAEAADEYVRLGMPRDEARRAARRNFGGVAQTEQIHREMRAFGWLDDLRQDIRYTGRTFISNPLFTLVAVVTLALGIGATTSIFTLLDAVVFKPLPVPAAHELVTFYENEPGGTPDAEGGTGRFLRFSFDRFLRLQDALGARGSIAAVTRSTRLIVRLPGESERRLVIAQLVSGGYFDTLRVQAARGRTIAADDVRIDRPAPVAVVSDGFWRRTLGGSDRALGQTITVNGLPITIVGIAPRGFVGMWTDAEADVWLPLTLQLPLHYINNSSSYGPIDNTKPWVGQPISWLNLIGRIPRGDIRSVMPLLQAANRSGIAELMGTMDSPKSRELMLARTLAAEPLSAGFSGLRARFSDALFALSGMVALVLLVTCANIANLLLARAAARAHDFRLRISLGATTGRLVRQCLTESAALAFLGGAGGVFLSGWGSAALARQVFNSAAPLPMVFSRDGRVFAFAVVVSISAAIVFGLFPALRAIAAGRLAAAGAHQRQPFGRSTLPGMRGIVVAQLALSVVMVSAAVLLGRTLITFMRIDPGFEVARLMTVSFDPVSSGYALKDVPALARRIVAAAQSVPGVVSSAGSTCGLIANCTSTGGFLVEGAGPDNVSLYRNWVSPGYLATVGIPLVRGREFSDRDTAQSPRVAIVNETVARRYFRGQDPIGKRLGSPSLDTEIVGVARDARTQSLHDAPVPMVYIPIEQKPADQQPTMTNLDVRVAGTPATINTALRQAIRQVEPNLLVGDVGVMSRRLERDLTRERVVAYLSLGFGALTMVLAAIGLYGVLSFGVARRTQEIGIRMALGARRIEVLRLVGGQSARLAIVGLTLGLLATWGAARYLSGALTDAAPLDRTTILLVTLAFVAVTALASYLPARRAATVDPLVALRSE